MAQQRHNASGGLTGMRSKTTPMAEAVAAIGDGASVMIGGFGVPGTPFCLIEELARQGAKELTIIKNDANEAGMGVDLLLQNRQVARLITSHIGLNANAIRLMNAGEIEVELVSQGILAERIRAGGAGLVGIVTDIGLGTPLAKGKTMLSLAGREAIFEPALTADFALLHAERADDFGNLSYAATARNFNPLMAMAASCSLAETEILVAQGQMIPEAVHTPGVFVDHVMELAELPEVYHVVRR